jgi:hypothetical protein
LGPKIDWNEFLGKKTKDPAFLFTTIAQFYGWTNDASSADEGDNVSSSP